MTRPQEQGSRLPPAEQAVLDRVAALFAAAGDGDPSSAPGRFDGPAHQAALEAMSKLDWSTQRAVARAIATSGGDLEAVRRALTQGVSSTKARAAFAPRPQTVVDARPRPYAGLMWLCIGVAAAVAMWLVVGTGA